MLASPTMPMSDVRIVLVRPQGGGNVGAVARAMKNMGLHDLALVRPASADSFWAEAMAVHADDVLRAARRHDTLADAVADCGLVVGTTCRGGQYRAAAESPRAAAARIVAATATNRVALVFGPEDHGLSNEDIRLCQQFVVIPTAPEYPSLNLAQAVLVCCYEVFLARDADCAPAPELAPAARVEFMFERLQAALLAIGYLHDSNPEHIMYTFRRIFGRAQLEDRDVRVLLGLARQIEWYAQGGWQQMVGRG